MTNDEGTHTLSAAEELKQRYRRVETVADAFGRIITVRRLRPGEQMEVREWAETDAVVAVYQACASVSKIDEAVIAFPKSKAEVKATLNTLDMEGLNAVSKAVALLNGFEKKDGDANLQAE